MLKDLNWLIIATFGVSGATAVAITGVIVKAGTAGMSMSRVITLIAATGVGAIVVGGLAAIGLWWLSNYVKKNGEAALTQW